MRTSLGEEVCIIILPPTAENKHVQDVWSRSDSVLELLHLDVIFFKHLKLLGSVNI